MLTLVVQPDEQRVRAVRSPVQTPGLHVRDDHRAAVIASTLRAVLAACDLPPEVDKQTIAVSLYLNHAEAECGW